MLAEMRHAIHGSKSLVPLFDTLWVNENIAVNSEFAEQTITINENLNDYNVFLVIVGHKISAQESNQDSMIAYLNSDNESAFLNFKTPNITVVNDAATISNYSRIIEIYKETGTVDVGNCNYSAYTGSLSVTEVRNKFLIPIAILGTKI